MSVLYLKKAPLSKGSCHRQATEGIVGSRTLQKCPLSFCSAERSERHEAKRSIEVEESLSEIDINSHASLKDVIETSLKTYSSKSFKGEG